MVASGGGLVLTCFYTKRLPVYSDHELQVLLLLFLLFITVNGLQRSGAISRIAQCMENGGFTALKLTVATFFLSTLVTNDVALITIVPLTLAINVNRKGILVILETLAANAGSALTPMGNPQNLYIYWFYGCSAAAFIKTIAPFSLTFLVLLITIALFVETENISSHNSRSQKMNDKAYGFGILLVILLLIIFHVLPISVSVAVILFAFIFDRQSFKIDYTLLLTFLFFFGISDNIKVLIPSEIAHSSHTFLFAVLASQIMSNVPAALLFTKFTRHWQPLLWGVNTGGFGSLFGSLANLIAYKIYITNSTMDDTDRFTMRFLVAGYMALIISIGLYYQIYGPPIS